MIINIDCNLYQLEVGGSRGQPKKILSPNVEINWDDGHYVALGRNVALGRSHHGLQCDECNYDEIMEKCSQIATNMFELYDILKKEKGEKNNEY